MSLAEGVHIESCVLPGESGSADPLEGAPRALVSIMEQAWQRGQSHGDLGFRNILFATEAKRIALIDAGTPEACPVCSGFMKLTRSAALDLSHLLCMFATDVGEFVGGSQGRDRKQAFVEQSLIEYVVRAHSPEGRQLHLESLRTCARAHLDDMLRSSWSPRGLWYKFVRQIAVSRIEAIFLTVASEIARSAAAAGHREAPQASALAARRA
jgi:hypothetical protein